MPDRTWREQFDSMLWDHFYILDTERCGVKQAKAEQRVKPAGDEFKEYMRQLCERAEKEGRRVE